MILRPKTSLKGLYDVFDELYAGLLHAATYAKAMGPMSKPTTKSVIASNDTSCDIPRSSAGPIISAVMTDDAKATTKQTKAIIMVQYHLNNFDQFLGFSGSLMSKVTSFQSTFSPVAREMVRLTIRPP